MKPPPPPLRTPRRRTSAASKRADDAGDIESEHDQALEPDAAGRRCASGMKAAMINV